jgi:hypothetical protein
MEFTDGLNFFGGQYRWIYERRTPYVGLGLAFRASKKCLYKSAYVEVSVPSGSALTAPLSLSSEPAIGSRLLWGGLSSLRGSPHKLCE